MNKKLLLIDGNSLVYRAYYSMAKTQAGIIKNTQGLPVNSILVFAKMINSLLVKYKPTHLLVAFDAGKKTNRHEEYPEYKANRPSMPDELRIQLPLIKEMLDHMKIMHFELKGVEADDIIGSIATQAKQNADVFIMSSDKDMFQLIDEHIFVIYPQPGSKPDLIYNPTSFEAQWGYKPAQVIDIKGLAGDASDNLPGVKGIGAKGAVNLIQTYHNLESIYKNIAQIKETTRDKLIASEANARMSKKLATLATELDLKMSLKHLVWSPSDISDTLTTFFERIEIRSLIKVFQQLAVQSKISDRIVF